MDKISVIIPVYNVEHYIDRCIKSIIAQTYTNMEIILVDDGSNDGSGKICDEYGKQDSRIIVIHQENGGLSSARNTGIAVATGKYLVFIDSDDFVSSNYLDYLYSNLVSANADISVCGYKKTSKNKEVPEVSHEKIALFNSMEATLSLLYQKDFVSSAWAKLYKRELWDNIVFPVGMLHEDVAVMYKIFRNAKRIVCGNARLYFYFIREGSIVNSGFNPKRMDYIKHTLQCVEALKSDKRLYHAALSRHFSACFELLNILNKESGYKKEKEFLIRQIKKYKYNILFDSHARIINRGAALISLISVKLAINLCNKLKLNK